VAKLKGPVMLVYADSDMFRYDHIVKFYTSCWAVDSRTRDGRRENMSKNRLAIIPDQTHYDLFVSAEARQTVMPFLDGKSSANAWK
jgi:hypothetical protein